MTSKISMIAAIDENRVIGNKGALPWHIKKDFAWFVEKTKGKNIVMGRKNYEDIIKYTKGLPLKNRNNIILTTKKIQPEGFEVFHSIDSLLLSYPDQELCIIGGAEIYEQFLPYTKELILTEIRNEYVGDTFFPDWKIFDFKEVFRRTEMEDNLSFDFVIYERTF